ncbi:MAG: L-fucokinase [Phycisphaerales bacterium]
MVVASGDAALRLTGERIALDGRDATVVAFPAGPARAARHGVFVVDRRGRVRRTLQKPTRAQLAEAGALDARGQALVDGGIFFFPPAARAARHGVFVVDRPSAAARRRRWRPPRRLRQAAPASRVPQARGRRAPARSSGQGPCHGARAAPRSCRTHSTTGAGANRRPSAG